MSFLLLIIWQSLFILHILDWPVFGLEVERPITALFMLAAVAIFLTERKKKLIGPEFWLLTGFTVTILVSGFVNGWLGGGVTMAQNFVLTAFLPYLLYANHAISITKQHILMLLLLVYSLVMVHQGVSQLESPDGIGWAGSNLIFGRITFMGILEDPNDLGQFFVMCIPFAAYFFRHGSFSFNKLFAAGVLLLLCYGIFLTNSRGTLLAVLGILLCYIYYRFGTGKAVLALVTLSPGILFVISQFRVIELDSNAMGRADTWYLGMQLLEQYPIFGVGMGNFLDYSSITAHNSFVLVMSELGVIGYIFWLSLIVISLATTLHIAWHYRKLLIQNKYRKLPPTELNRALALNTSILFSLVGYLACAFFLSRSYSALLFMLCAFSVASYMRVTRLAPELKIQQPKILFRYTMAGSFVSIIGMYAVVRVILLQ